MTSFAALREAGERDVAGLPAVRVAVAADSEVRHLAAALRGAGALRGLDVRVTCTTLADAGAAEADFLLLWRSAESLLHELQATPPDERAGLAERWCADVERIASRAGCPAIVCNVPDVDDGVFGDFANTVPGSWRHQSRTLNVLLMRLAAERGDLFVCDLALLWATLGQAAAHDPRLAVRAGLALGLDALAELAVRAVGIVAAVLGRARKCLALDLDGTLWGGIVAEVGVEHLELGELGVGAAYTALQRWALELHRRGVVIVACSKNDEGLAREVFDRHPGMVLRREHFTLFLVSWESKVESLRRVASELGVLPDSIVFVDDSAIERERVRASLPEVCVPELPPDPVDVLAHLRRLNLFETASFTAADAARPAHYRAEHERRALRDRAQDEEAFLAGLRMRATVEPFHALNLPRVAQLTQRSNQFNLRDSHHTEEELRALAGSPRHRTLAVTLADRLGDYGLVGAAVLRRDGDAMAIDAWVVSCRAFDRGVERLMLEAMAGAAREAGAAALAGEYRPSARNGLVADLFERLGFAADGDRWRLGLEAFAPPPHAIERAAA